MKEKWVRVTDAGQLNVGDKVRFKDEDVGAWIGEGGDRQVLWDGRIGDPSGDFPVTWGKEELLNTWDVVEVLRLVESVDFSVLLAECPDLPDDWDAFNPDAIKAFTPAFVAWKERVAAAMQKEAKDE